MWSLLPDKVSSLTLKSQVLEKTCLKNLFFELDKLTFEPSTSLLQKYL